MWKVLRLPVDRWSEKTVRMRKWRQTFAEYKIKARASDRNSSQQDDAWNTEPMSDMTWRPSGDFGNSPITVYGVFQLGALRRRVSLTIVTCRRNRASRPSSNIHYPVPNPRNVYPVFRHIQCHKFLASICIRSSVWDSILQRFWLYKVRYSISNLTAARVVVSILSSSTRTRTLCSSTSTFLANVNSRSRSLYSIARTSVCLSSVVCLSVTLVHPIQAVQIFGNISMTFDTLATLWHP